MRDFPFGFGENGVQVADSSSSSTTKAAQSSVTCVYQCKLLGRYCLITVTWTKSLMGQGLSISIDDRTNHCLCKVDVKPWLFSKRKGFKNVEVESGKMGVYWDLASAQFGTGPEPLESFYVAVVFNREIVLLLGDMKREAYKKIGAIPAPSNATFIAKREHIFGKKVVDGKAQFCSNWKMHSVTIECGLNDPCLVICVDSKTVMRAKQLRWKFRGNHTILVDGVPVEVLWDVHNWLFGNAMGNVVFMFQTDEKLWSSQSCSQQPTDSPLQGLGFSLILYAWKNE